MARVGRSTATPPREARHRAPDRSPRRPDLAPTDLARTRKPMLAPVRPFSARFLSFVILLTGVFQASIAHAFKIEAHVASANEVLDQLARAIPPSGDGTIAFDVKGRHL